MKLIVFAVLLFAFAPMSFAQNKKDFALYLLPKIMSEKLSKLDLQKLKPKGAPFLTADDFLSYNKDTYQMMFHYRAGEKLKKLKIPEGGLSFIVFAGGEPVYTGAFWKGFSSPTFKGVAVDVSKLEGDYPIITLELDYPPLAPKNPAKDPRNDERILQAFKNSSRLLEQVWILGKCRAIRGTGKRRQSFIFTFDVVTVAKSTYNFPEVVFEINDDYGKSLREALGAESVTGSFMEENWRFNKERKFLLKFVRNVSDKDQDVSLYDFEIAEGEK